LVLTGKTIRVAASLALMALAFGVLVSTPRAQGGLTITFGSFNSSAWPAGPDYASDVLGDAWDLCNQEDLGLDPSETRGWANFTVNDPAHACQAGGTTALVGGAVDSAMSLLYRGFYGLPNPGKTGRRFPIDTSKYQKLAFRMSDSLGGGDNPQVYWFHYAWSDPAIPASDPTHTGFGVRLLGGTVPGFQTYVVDLSQAASDGLPWTSGNVVGFRLDPNGTHVGQDIYFDWVRLTYNDGAPGAAMQTISWSGPSGRIELYDAGGTTRIMTIANSASSPYQWNYGVVPPGTYTLRVTAGASVGNRAFTINNPPVVQVTEPDETGADDDYATTVLGNPWDMDAPADVQLTGADNYTPAPASFAGGIMSATNTSNDPAVTLLYNSNNAVPIDATKYRYLTFRMQLDGPLDIANGSVARVFWSSQPFMNGATATTTKDIIVWSGWNSYTIDLGALYPGGDGGLETTGAAEPWTAAAKRHFRLDPHEFVAARGFHIDYVKLAPMDHTTNNSFTIKWTGSDADGGIPALNLYYDTDTNPSNGKTLIASGVSMSAGQFAWATGGVAPGDYWIYIEASDGVQVVGRYSTGQVRVTNSAPVSSPAMSLETPSNGATLAQPFLLGGWAADLGSPSGTGVDAVHVWAYPAGGGAPTFVGVAQYAGVRGDVGAAYGAQFTNSGYNLTVAGLAPGTYTLVASAHSTVALSFNQSRSVTLTIPTSLPLMSIDVPANHAAVGSSFNVAGWAIDRAVTSGNGVDYVDVYAWQIHNPDDGFIGSATFLGRANTGQSRGDVGAAYGAQFSNAGFSLTASGLPSGAYRIVGYGHSVASGMNNEKSADIIVGSPANPAMSVDTPGPGAGLTQPFNIGGWAIDRGAPSGTGVSTVHVWAFPVAGGPSIFVGIASYGAVRSDIGSLFGGSFTNSGFNLGVSGLPKGTYDLSISAYSTVTGSFNQARAVRITIN